MKIVRTEKPFNDGSWSTAEQWKFNCKQRTIQTLASSTYDVNGKFIKSNSDPAKDEAVIPDSTGDGMLKIACAPSFPNDKSEENYFKLQNNEPLQTTRNIVEAQKSKVDSAPQ